MRRLVLLALLLGPAVALAEEEVRPAAIPPLETSVVLTGHEGLVRTLVFHPEGALLASRGPDRTLRLWSLEKEASIAVLTLPRAG
jgi:WD40 repeat protein